MTKQFSDEFINSYLDDELEHDDRQELLDAIRHDSELSGRVCKLKNVKDMVQLAYQIETIPTSNKGKNSYIQWYSLAASVLIIAGISIGWFAKDFSAQPSLSELAQTVQLPVANSSQAKKDWRLMLHVSSYDPKRYNLLINETEELLKTSLENNEPVQIELLTNSSGLSLLKDDDREFAKRLNDLAAKYDNFRLLACEKALTRLKVEKGINLKLIPEAQKVGSAIHHLIQRQKEGWSYIHI
jgi:intracellular sulfur oxidation DsrE/DsrF family protein